MSLSETQPHAIQSFNSYLTRTLSDFSIAKNGFLCGFLNSEEEFQSFLTGLKCMGYAFAVRRSINYNRIHDKNFDNTFPESSDSAGGEGYGTSFFFQYTTGDVPIPFFGPVFTVENVSRRDCVLGPRYYGKTENVAIPSHLADHVISRKRKLPAMDTKKCGCPAVLNAKCIRVYPDFSIPSTNVNWRAKKKVIDSLKNSLASSDKPRSYLRYCVTISPAEFHSHSTENVFTKGELHPLLVKEIENLVGLGITSVKDIKSLLKKFIEREFPEGNKPEVSNTIFFPSDKTIYNNMYRARLKKRKTGSDQDTLETQKWESDDQASESETAVAYILYAAEEIGDDGGSVEITTEYVGTNSDSPDSNDIVEIMHEGVESNSSSLENDNIVEITTECVETRLNSLDGDADGVKVISEGVKTSSICLENGNVVQITTDCVEANSNSLDGVGSVEIVTEYVGSNSSCLDVDNSAANVEITTYCVETNLDSFAAVGGVDKVGKTDECVETNADSLEANKQRLFGLVNHIVNLSDSCKDNKTIKDAVELLNQAASLLQG